MVDCSGYLVAWPSTMTSSWLLASYVIFMKRRNKLKKGPELAHLFLNLAVAQLNPAMHSTQDVILYQVLLQRLVDIIFFQNAFMKSSI